MSTFGPPLDACCDTTCIRYFTICGSFDLLAAVLGGRVRVPRQVFSPDEDPTGIQSLLSELGRTERHFSRALDAESTATWSRLRSLRQRADIDIVDLDEKETQAFAELTSHAFARARRLVARLGPGEAAVMAACASRGWTAVLDDGAARVALHEWAPAVKTVTTCDLLRMAVAQALATREDADVLYAAMRDASYRGPESLWPDEPS